MLWKKGWAALLAVCLALGAAQAQEEQPAVYADFDMLQTMNPDCAAWIYQPESDLNQPVMQGATDSYYADRSFEQASARGRGCVYIRADASLDDAVLWLYGNSQVSGAPLYGIREYSNQDYYQQHPSFWLLTPRGDWRLDVFACLRASGEPDSFYQPDEQAGYDQWLAELLAASDITPLDGALPRQGDRLAMIANNIQGTRMVLCAVMRPAALNGQDAVNLPKAELDGRETYAGYAQVGTLGRMMIYAQNDPLWERMRYESKMTAKYRNLGGGGCGPTAVAMAVANLTPAEDLPKLRQYAGNDLGTLFCQCSVNRLYCSRRHVPYLLETGQEYLRYLPVAMANFAAGNNQWQVKSRINNGFGTKMDFLPYICQIYGLEYTPVQKLKDALEILEGKAGRGLVISCALRGPFTASSHYVVIAGMDEAYVYLLDPLRRTQKEYTRDYADVLQVLTPGVIRVQRDLISRCNLSPVAYLENPSLTHWAVEE